jgi:hypothetical protein
MMDVMKMNSRVIAILFFYYCESERGMIETNDGTRHFVSHGDHHVSHISDTYIDMKAEFTFQLSQDDMKRWAACADAPRDPQSGLIPADPDCLCKLFIGFKSGNQIFHQGWIRSNNHETGYEPEMLREGYALSHAMDYNIKKGNKRLHSPWEDVSKYDELVHGCYLNLQDCFPNNNTGFMVPIELIIPVDNLAALRAFDFNPTAILETLNCRSILPVVGWFGLY